MFLRARRVAIFHMATKILGHALTPYCFDPGKARDPLKMVKPNLRGVRLEKIAADCFFLKPATKLTQCFTAVTNVPQRESLARGRAHLSLYAKRGSS